MKRLCFDDRTGALTVTGKGVRDEKLLEVESANVVQHAHVIYMDVRRFTDLRCVSTTGLRQQP